MIVCQDCGRSCDGSRALIFDDIGEAALFWCEECYPLVSQMNAALQEALRDMPGFAEKLDREISRYEKDKS